MKTMCLYFQIHQPLRLKRYRFFDIGKDSYYYDEYANESIIRRKADDCYLPANKALLEMIKSSEKKFKVSFSLSGVVIDQLEQFAPEVIDSFKELAKTGNVEFLSETYAHSLSSIYNEEEFVAQVKMHAEKIKALFGKTPTAFRNTELIYSDEIADTVARMGYKVMLTEGAKHVLGWKGPNNLYSSVSNQKLKLMMRNFNFSDDISFRFSNWRWNQYPLTAEKYMQWIAALPKEEPLVNVFLGYEAFGENHRAESGIFDFLKALPLFAEKNQIVFATPTEVATTLKAVAAISVPYPMSWADEEKDLSAWMGNDLQKEALQKLYNVAERVRLCSDNKLKYDWINLQSSDHFYYMCTKHFSGGTIPHSSPYESPYDAFMNYMNVLSDFLQRVAQQYPDTIDNEELNALLQTINNQEKKIQKLEAQLKKTKSTKK
jgi:alpha-amylase